MHNENQKEQQLEEEKVKQKQLQKESVRILWQYILHCRLFFTLQNNVIDFIHNSHVFSNFLIQDAYVESLDGSQLFDSLYAEDPEGQKLSMLPGLEEMLQVSMQFCFDWKYLMVVRM